MTTFTIGKDLILKIDSNTFEYMWRAKECIYFRDIRTQVVIQFSEAELLQEIVTGEVQVLNAITTQDALVNISAPLPAVDFSCETKWVNDTYSRHHAYVQAYLQSGVTPSNRLGQARVIETTAKEINDANPPRPATVYSWSLVVRKKFNDPIASLPGRRGRPRLAKLAICDLGKTDNPTDYLVQVSWKKDRLKPDAPQASNAYRTYQNLVISYNAKNSDPAENARTLSERQYNRRFKAQITPFDQVAATEGLSTARNKFHVNKKHYREIPPCEIFQNDDKFLKLYVVDEATGWPLGSAKFTGFRCAGSHYVGGFYVYYTAPAEAAFLGAIRQSLESKHYVREQWPDIETPLLSTGLANKYTYDRARFNLTMSTINNLSSNNLNADWTPARTPWAKWVIEGLNSLIENKVIDGMPGAMSADPKLFREYNPREHRLVTNETLNWAFHKVVCDVLHNTPTSHFAPPPQQAMEEHLSLYPARYPMRLNDIDLFTGMTELKSISNKGITVHYLTYSSGELAKLWKKMGRHQVMCRMNPSRPSRIAIFDPFAKIWMVVPCTSPKYISGITLYQHRIILRMLKAERKSICESALLDYRAAMTERLQKDLLLKRKGPRDQKYFSAGVTSEAKWQPMIQSVPPQSSIIEPNDDIYDVHFFPSEFSPAGPDDVGQDDWAFDHGRRE